MEIKPALKKRILRTGLYVLAIAIFVVMMFPIYTLLLISVIPRVVLYTKPLQLIPWSFTLQWYEEVLVSSTVRASVVAIREAMINTLIVASFATLLSITLGSLAAYAFARLRFPHRERILSSLLMIYLLPSMLFLIPIFVIMRFLGLLDTYLSLIIPYSVWLLPFIILILKSFFETIPQEIEDAAQVDGCSRLGAVRRIILPLSAPGLVAAGIYAFVLSWNEFLTPLVLTSELKMLTTALGLYTSTYDIQLGLMSATGILSILPVLLLALGLQRYIVKGIVEGAIKG